MNSLERKKRPAVWAAVIAAAVTLLAAWRLGWPGPIEAVDQRQTRLDMAAPLPSADLRSSQSFIAQRDGLTAIDLLLVVYPPADDTPQSPAVLTLRLLDAAGEQVAASSWESSSLTHNERLRFAFPPISNSAGQQYQVQLEGTAANRATVWAYSLEGYARGQLAVNGEPQIGSLQFQTIYRYRWPAAIRDCGELLSTNLGLLLTLLPLLFLPGMAIFAGTWRYGRDVGVWLGIALGGSLACLPIAWLWLTYLGGRWRAPLTWLLLIASLLGVLWRWRAGRCKVRLRWETWILAAILLLGLCVRLLAVRDLVLPAWVDSPQHWLISRMMADSGTVPADYRPWMPVDVFAYHFGFHALAASFHQLTGFPLEQILLIGGQLLNALTPLSLYAATVMFSRRRSAGLVAAFFVAFLSLFPAYYVTWGRYTQLTGILILSPLLGLVYRFIESVDQRGFHFLWRPAGTLGLLLGGLFLVHARVWVFALVWLLVASVAGVRGRGKAAFRRAGAIWQWMGVVLAVSLLLSWPWCLRLLEQLVLPLSKRALAGGGDPGTYNDFPWNYLTYGWERTWLIWAAFGLLWAAMQLWQGRPDRRRWLPVSLLGLWTLAVFGVVNANRLGFPTFGLVNNNTWFITLYVPVGILIGAFAAELLRIAGRSSLGRLLAGMGGAAILVWSGLFGLREMAAVVNPETVLARPDDMVMLEWADDLPADALVAVNAWIWLGENNWAGPDGGYWLYPLTGRQTTMPPIGYGYNREYQHTVNAFNAKLAAVEDWNAPQTWALLAERGVTHIFIGERGGFFKPEKLIASPYFQLEQSNGAAWLFELVYSD